ncbi:MULTISPECIES: competence type IV pilus minor pilin ComGD [Bacillaceae]|uniref:Type II secretion system GspH family protein n=1 Tax=Evansella alkalicola TaxID=745819 RepID=A0ABS6K025_9BACI|nr:MULTISPECIES: competence type IV pilus minor pilin ComGD [Bacillaceae]MBU9724194.1 type II secretion system GspH family protein [Bacillus alkalicola]
MNKRFNQMGYTLLETIIVMSLLSTILLITFPLLTRDTVNNQPAFFFEQLEKDLYEAQMLSMTDGLQIRVFFNQAAGEYTIRDGTNIIEKRIMPKGMNVFSGTLDFRNIRFIPNGRIWASGTINFIYKGRSYMLVFQFLRGRFYVQEF